MTYSVIIDTDTYSGNFERALTDYITGSVGECEVGCNFDFDRSKVLTNETVDVSDDSGVYRPCAIAPTPNYFNNGMGGHYRDDPENEEQALIDHRNSVDKYLEIYPNSTIQHRTELQKLPAYQSVEIFFENVLTKEDMALLRQRAEEFFEIYAPNERKIYGSATAINILDIKMVQSVVTTTVTKIDSIMC